MTYPRLHMVIDGESVGVGDRRTHPVINPATGDRLADLPLADPGDLDRALETAARGFRIWRQASAAERAAVLQGAARLLLERADDLARTATLEQGKPLAEARIEVAMVANLFNFYAAETQRLYGRALVRPHGTRATVVREPVGPVAAFAPWNFPIGNPGRKLGAPIAAGCSVIMKPAEEAPASALGVLQALLDAGLPREVGQIVFGVPDEVSRHLLASPIIRKVSFTGSTAVGRRLITLAAEGLKRTTMELGGHAPVLVFDDADLDHALGALVGSKHRNAGQVCISPTRFYVQEGVYDRFMEAFTARAAALSVGDGLDPAHQMGPMANARRPAAVGAMVDQAVAKGARLKTGGAQLGERGFFYAPTVLTEVPTDAEIMNEEPFGPVALINPFR
ncbi:MAG TPA: NAD-dependent succinate-semialdehyde dehydrogenase, partial [Phenylobacterium sp.]|nr:NAD-dependent succinate-semialdehyde dehydrogenase [Phenylobacterium sp.]